MLVGIAPVSKLPTTDSDVKVGLISPRVPYSELLTKCAVCKTGRVSRQSGIV